MAIFSEAVNKTLSFEGGYTSGEGDYGGETKFGISKRSYPNVDIVKLTVEEAKEIYKRDYWDRLGLDRVKSQAIAEEVFDSAVNVGWGQAGRWLQSGINLIILGRGMRDAGEEKQIKVDGIVGPATLGELGKILNEKGYKVNEDVLLKCLNAFQVGHYINQARQDPNQTKFLMGWIYNRVKM